MISLNWPLVLSTTVILYVLILVTLPFNAVYATVFLFTLIGFWSRLPGVGIIHPFYILYLMDLIDIFTVVIAVNLGGLYGGVYALFGNLWSRACGVYPEWNGIISDSFAQFFAALVLPLFHAAMGGDVLVSIIIFSFLRLAFIIPLDQIFYRIPFVKYVIEIVLGGGALLLINVLYAKIFGSFFDNLMQKGVQFSWVLFLFATIVILVFYISVFGKKSSKKQNPVKNVAKIMHAQKNKLAMNKKKNVHKRKVENSKEVDDMMEIKRNLGNDN